MKILRLLILAGLALSSAWPLAAQNRHCATQVMWQHKADADPAYALRRAASEARNQAWISQHPDVRKTASVVTIPVVVHVVYNNSTENISNAQIQSQIDALNLDYRLLNSDSLPDSHPFWVHTADCEIEFCLASVDPNGNSTTGITRTSTSHGQFVNAGADDIKFTNSGGHDNWDPTHYLNIWVGDIGNSLYGYATFPSDLAASPEYDGVVINYTAFGTTGTAQAPADLGRTATHEIGHWLDLSHIWGDQFCGDDLVSDTEPAEDANYGCFNFPHNANNSCGAGPNGEMYMNYMDYTDDNCMAMFTFGQKSRMYAALNGDRSEMLHSGGCLSTAAPTAALTGKVTMYPNPSTGKVVIESGDFSPKTNLTVVNALGHVVLQQDRIGGFPYSLDLSSLPGDIYFVKLSDGRHLHTQKIVLTH